MGNVILIKKGSKEHGGGSILENKNNRYAGHMLNKNRNPATKLRKPYHKGPSFKTPEEWLEAVKKNGTLIRNMEVQPENICVEAVKQNGLALKFIKNRYKTPKICVIAVGQNGLALKYVNEQSEKICLTAIKQNPMAIEYVIDRNEEMCNIAKTRFNDWLDSLK
jgi:hypothetical protein